MLIHSNANTHSSITIPDPPKKASLLHEDDTLALFGTSVIGDA